MTRAVLGLIVVFCLKLGFDRVLEVLKGTDGGYYRQSMVSLAYLAMGLAVAYALPLLFLKVGLARKEVNRT